MLRLACCLQLLKADMVLRSMLLLVHHASMLCWHDEVNNKVAQLSASPQHRHVKVSLASRCTLPYCSDGSEG